MSSQGHPSYKRLKKHAQEIATYSSILGLLEWDQEVCMPENSVEVRSKQFALMSKLIHTKRTSASFEKKLRCLIDLETGKVLDPSLPSKEQRALQQFRRDFILMKKLPSSFVSKMSEVRTQASSVWSMARKQQSFLQFAPYLDQLVTLFRKQADLLGYAHHPYDALLDYYEPELSVGKIFPIFDNLKEKLQLILQEVKKKPQIDTSFLHVEYPHARQKHFGQFLLEKMGFTPKDSRLDESEHPFSLGISPLDTRLTSHIHPNNPISNITSVLHEGGHGCYNAGLPFKEFGTPLAESASLAFDESQARFWETFIGQSFSFWKYFYPHLQKHFPEQLSSISLETFYSALTQVKPNVIRIHSDEISYHLHIIIRFEIEMALIEGSLKVKDLPDVWDEKYVKYLGIKPAHAGEGCLQDIHWASGSMGYFPTYTLGTLYGAQIFDAFQESFPDWEERVAQGNLLFIREYLTNNIYQHGRAYTPEELIQNITGKPLTEDSFIAYLNRKYLGKM